MTSPPERLRCELARLRDRGLSFTQAWPVAMSLALRDEPMASAFFWRTTFNEQRTVWLVSYSRTPWPARGIDLSIPDDDRSAPADRRPTLTAAV